MTIDEFRATRQPCSDEMYAAVLENCDPAPAQNTIWVYGDGYVLHEADGGFWPHAWWYRPAKHDTLQGAEEVLYAWRAEFE